MENLEQKIAKHLLFEYKMLTEVLESFKQSKSDEAFIRGQIIAIKKTASSIWGKEKGLDSHFEFIENLKEIANAEPQANLVEVSRFEAFGLYKHYSAKSVNAMQEGFSGASQSYYEKAEKWLNVSVKIEKADADGVNKNLVLG